MTAHGVVSVEAGQADAPVSAPADAVPGVPAPGQPEPVVEQPKQPSLGEAVRQIGEATHAWGVRRDSAEGAFVSAFMAAVTAVGGVVEGARAEFRQIFDQQREAGKDELARVKELTKAAGLALSQARQAGLSLEVEQANLALRMVDRTLPLFAEKLQGALVLREQRLNFRILLRHYAVAGSVTLALVAGGYGLRAWQDSGAVAALADCLAHPYQAGGRTYCDVTALLAGR